MTNPYELPVPYFHNDTHTAQHASEQRDLLGAILWEILKAAGILNDEVVARGAEVLMHGNGLAEALRSGEVKFSASEQAEENGD